MPLLLVTLILQVLDESCDGEGNFSAFMTIAHVESSDDLSALMEELGEHTELESIGILEDLMMRKMKK